VCKTPADPAIAVVPSALRRDRPDVPIAPRRRETRASRCANLKVANLMNMLPSARYDRLVMVDSDYAGDTGFPGRRRGAPGGFPRSGLGDVALYRGRGGG